MQKINKISVIILFIAVSAGFLVFSNTSAESLSDQQIETIKNNCLVTKNTLNQVHSSDALLRVNMGQYYESMSTKLMTRLNNRLSSAGYDNSSFKSINDNYGSALDKFRLDYKTYEQSLSSAINTDCNSHPSEFYVGITLAQTNRNQVHEDVVNLNSFIDQYSSAVSQFETDFQSGKAK